MIGMKGGSIDTGSDTDNMAGMEGEVMPLKPLCTYISTQAWT